MSTVDYALRDGVAHLAWDDGKANAVSSAAVSHLNAALDRAEQDEATAIALIGRPGRFCAGFDLNALRAGGDGSQQLVRAGAELMLRLYEHEAPVVVGCSGHALGMGALLLLGADVRIGAPGPYKIGLNEVSISLSLPTFGTEMAAARLSRRHLTRAAQLAEVYDPPGAVDAGFLDALAPDGGLEEAVLAEATRLGAFSRRAHAETKQRLHAATAERIRASIEREF